MGSSIMPTGGTRPQQTTTTPPAKTPPPATPQVRPTAPKGMPDSRFQEVLRQKIKNVYKGAARDGRHAAIRKFVQGTDRNVRPTLLASTPVDRFTPES
jgi:hypothetical protein